MKTGVNTLEHAQIKKIIANDPEFSVDRLSDAYKVHKPSMQRIVDVILGKDVPEMAPSLNGQLNAIKRAEAAESENARLKLLLEQAGVNEDDDDLE